MLPARGMRTLDRVGAPTLAMVIVVLCALGPLGSGLSCGGNGANSSGRAQDAGRADGGVGPKMTPAPPPSSDASRFGGDAGSLGAALGTPGARSGLAWMSGSNGDPEMIPKSYDAFGAWRGRPEDLAMMYTDRSSWEGVTGAGSFVFSKMAGWPGKLVISQPLFPEDGSTLAGCAAGNYDAHWRDFGSALVTNQRADSIVRVGWAFNGHLMYWHATNDTASFIACWNHVASSIKSADPQALLDWTINAHGTASDSCHGDPTKCYPGDTYVDYIGIDNYDQYPPSTETPFETIADAPGGLSWLYDFAAQHHKRFGVGEWGAASGSGANGGYDNPAFVVSMWSWLSAHASIGLYEMYFNDSEAGSVDSAILELATGTCGCDNPMASAKYAMLYHP